MEKWVPEKWGLMQKGEASIERKGVLVILVQTCGLCEGVTTLESSNEKEETDDPKKEKEADVSKLSYKERRRLAILKALRNRMARRRVGDRRRRDRK